MTRVFNLVSSTEFSNSPAYAAGFRFDGQIEQKSWMKYRFSQ